MINETRSCNEKKKYPKFLKSKAGIIIRISMSFIVHCNILEPTEDFLNYEQKTGNCICDLIIGRLELDTL